MSADIETISERTEWLTSLADDCHAILTEAVHNSRWDLLVGYHAVGMRIISDPDYQRHTNGNRKTLQMIAEQCHTSERSIYYAVQFATRYPVLDNVPEGKNISWSKLTAKYLPATTEIQSAKATTPEWIIGVIERNVEKLLNEFPDYREAMVQAFWNVLGGEWSEQ